MVITNTKREMVFGGLLTVFWGATCTTCAAQHRTVTGCDIPEAQTSDFFGRRTSVQSFRTGSEFLEPRSGNPELDRAFAQSLGMLSRTFDVLPGFAYYQDGAEPNARATPEVLLDRTDGTVMFGLQFLQELLRRPVHPDASVVAVAAHEFGHIISYKHGYIGQLAPNRNQPFRAEQYADYIAGFFAGVRKLERPDFPAVVFATTQRSFGGPVRGSHGTGPERGAAVERGFADAFQRRLSPEQGIQAAFNYAMSVI